MRRPIRRWRPIPGFPRYWVSDDGKVWSAYKAERGKGGIKATVLNFGYPVVTLDMGGKHYARRVHALVLLAFVGPRPEGMDIRHLDGDRTNANLSNLRYGTRSENVRDAIKHGTHWTPFRHLPHLTGEDHPFAKLTSAGVAQIRASLAAGVSQARLADQWGVSRRTVSDIALRRTWREVA